MFFTSGTVNIYYTQARQTAEFLDIILAKVHSLERSIITVCSLQSGFSLPSFSSSFTQLMILKYLALNHDELELRKFVINIQAAWNFLTSL